MNSLARHLCQSSLLTPSLTIITLTQQELIKFAYDEKIVLMADEVYQENIYQDERPFVSARKVSSQEDQ